MNQPTPVLLQRYEQLQKTRNLDWPSLSNQDVHAIRRLTVDISYDGSHRDDQWLVHDLLMQYTTIFIYHKISLPNLVMLTREFDALHNFLLEDNLPHNRYKFAKHALWLAAKWGYDDKTYLDKCIRILSNEMRRGLLVNCDDLSSMLWSYATLLPLGHRPKSKFIHLWRKNFELVYKDVPINSQNWTQLIPALEFFAIPVPNGESIDPYFQAYLEIPFPHRVSDFERDVASNLDLLNVKYHRNARISIYSPDFVIEQGGKWLVLECDGIVYHPFPNLLRRKILRLHGYYVAHITDEEYTKLTDTQKLSLLFSILKELEWR